MLGSILTCITLRTSELEGLKEKMSNRGLESEGGREQGRKKEQWRAGNSEREGDRGEIEVETCIVSI